MAVTVEKRSGGNQREITTMLPISMTPKTAAHQHTAGEQDRPARGQGEDGAADGGEDKHAGHAAPRAENGRTGSRREICMAAKPKKEGACQRAEGFRPNGRGRASSRGPMVTLEARKEMAGHIGPWPAS